MMKQFLVNWLSIAIGLSAIGLYCTAPGYLVAQTSYGSLTGAVTDISGGVVADVVVRVKNVDTGVTVQTATTGAGLYNVTSLVPGQYTVEAEKSGFEKTLVGSVTILSSQTATIDITIKVGQTSTTITVTAQAPLLTTSTQAVATTVEQELAANLPYAERSTLGATILVPGVRGDPATPNQVASENPGIATGFIVPAATLRVGGAFPGRTSILVDGSDVTQTSYPRAGISVSGDMVRETTVITGGLPAEYGRSQGGVIIQATRSGTNEFHGGATWRHSDPTFQSHQLGSPLPPLQHQNFFGVYFGGPVVLPKLYNGRNRTFFYVGVEPARLNNRFSAQGVTETPDELAGHLNNSLALLNTTVLRSSGAEAALAAPRTGGLYYQYPVNAAGFPNGPQYANKSQYVAIPNNDVSAQLAQNSFAQFIMSQMPTPQNPGPNITFLRPDGLWMRNGNNVNFSRGVTNVDDRYSFRIDHVPTQKDRIFVRYTVIPVSATRYFALPADSPLTLVPGDSAASKNFAINESHVFNASVVNEFRFQYLRDRQLRTENAAALSKDWASSFGLTPATAEKGFPSFNLGFLIQIGNSGGSSQVDENYQFSDDVTWTHGKHTFKMGADVRRLESNQYNFGGAFGGAYGFSAGATNNGVSGGSTLATFDLGLITGFSNTPKPVPAYYRWHYYAGYFQDDWRISPRLTLNLGLRYEYESPRIEKFNNQGTFIPSLAGTLNGIPASGAFCFSEACGLHRTLWPSNYRGFEPRVGIAWTPLSRMTVRASYNLLRAPLSGYGNTPTPDFNVPSFAIGGQNGGVVPNQAVDYITNPVGPLSSALAALQGRGPFFTVQGLTVPYVSQSDAVPYTQQWSLTLQFQLSQSNLVQVGYNGLKGTHLITRIAPPLNYPNLTNLFNLIAQQYNFTPSQPNPYGITQQGVVIRENKFTALLPYQNFFNQPLQELFNRSGSSNYHALYLSLNHRFSHGLSGIASFSWSKSIDNGGGDQNSANNGVVGSAQVQNPYDLGGNRSVSNFDIPLSFTAGFHYDLPIGSKRLVSTHNKILDLIVGNWTTSGIYNVQAGYPFWVSLGSAGYWFSQGGGTTLPTGINLRPNIVDGQPCINSNWRNDPINIPYINANHFSMPGSLGAPGFGNAPASLTGCRSPKFTTFDANLYKRIPLGGHRNEKRYLEIGVNAINAFNHPAFFLNLNSGHNLYNAYNPASATNQSIPPFTVQPNFGFLGISNTPARLVQLSLRVGW